MDENTPLSCSICAKTFESRKSQTRHVSYCRKAKTRARSRKKSCKLCTKAKTRCDGTQPSCGRCVGKGVGCVYDIAVIPPVQPGTATNPSLKALDNPSMELVPRETEPVVPHLDLYFDARWPFDWSLGPTGPDPYSTDLPLFTPAPVPDLCGFGPTAESDYDELIPTTLPSTPFTPRPYIPSLSRSFVLCTLRSYPSMLLPNRTPPPFIHTTGVRTTTLHTCAAICQMWSTKTAKNTPFIWRTVKMEQARLLAKYMTFNLPETIAALQALAIYFLLRIQEEPPVEVMNKSADVALIRTMIKISLRSDELINQPHQGQPWERWIIAESLRRTFTVFCLIDLLFDITSVLYPYKCDGSLLVSMLLPCGRNVWTADSSREWEDKHAEDKGKGATYGDLMTFRLRRENESSLDGWLAAVDEFGTVVMAAAASGMEGH